MYLDVEIINILWKSGCKNMDMIYKILNINKFSKIEENKKITKKSREFYMKLDSIGEYNTTEYYKNNINELQEEWKYNRLWYNLHKELFIWHKYFYYSNNKNILKKNLCPK